MLFGARELSGCTCDSLFSLAVFVCRVKVKVLGRNQF